jgi:lipopolysaccharide/colanic/teichoic acid biosynthesis glycosyltransferase
MSSHTVEQHRSSPNADAVVASGPHAGGRLTDVACRTLDVVVSAALLLLTAPLLCAIAAAIRLDSPGPAVFRQRRVGRDGEPFTVNKFRSMHHGATHERHREFVLGLIRGESPRKAQGVQDAYEHRPPRPYYKMVADPRITRVGRLLRRSSLDELPQLWNVLRGDMSLVGPRPAIPYEVDHYPPAWRQRFAVKPGVTGLWQVSGRSRVTLAEMVRLDVEYAHRRTVWLNLWILIRTVPAVLGANGAW